ncbi:hypothetical protein ACTFIZ_003799 [Dictyostelium cf. discoideum]
MKSDKKFKWSYDLGSPDKPDNPWIKHGNSSLTYHIPAYGKKRVHNIKGCDGCEICWKGFLNLWRMPEHLIQFFHFYFILSEGNLYDCREYANSLSMLGSELNFKLPIPSPSQSPSSSSSSLSSSSAFNLSIRYYKPKNFIKTHFDVLFPHLEKNKIKDTIMISPLINYSEVKKKQLEIKDKRNGSTITTAIQNFKQLICPYHCRITGTSLAAMDYIKGLINRLGIEENEIQYKNSKLTKEKEVPNQFTKSGKHKVDFFIEKLNLAGEFHGSYFHGHPSSTGDYNQPTEKLSSTIKNDIETLKYHNLLIVWALSDDNYGVNLNLDGIYFDSIEFPHGIDIQNYKEENYNNIEYQKLIKMGIITAFKTFM